MRLERKRRQVYDEPTPDTKKTEYERQIEAMKKILAEQKDSHLEIVKQSNITSVATPKNFESQELIWGSGNVKSIN